ncbi:hypothetical protein TcasGA2_TC007617 [Tribolium castaneum]|uniref:Secreted protein n=1 Tax=Tribolium castaneum TaxID=7070 RepID=D2A2W0_TRICA|nr:hypothetical protein TcasGA2_TC007617 [Tribolium castaneum]
MRWCALCVFSAIVTLRACAFGSVIPCSVTTTTESLFVLRVGRCGAEASFRDAVAFYLIDANSKKHTPPSGRNGATVTLFCVPRQKRSSQNEGVSRNFMALTPFPASGKRRRGHYC